MFALVTISDIIAILTGLFCLRKGGPVILYLALLVISAAFINENIIVLHSKKWWHIHRNVFYNIYSFIEILCWFIIYWLISGKRVRVIVIAASVMVLLFSAWEIYSTSFRTFHTKSYSFYSIVSLLFSFGYLFKTGAKDYHRLTRDPAFCLCAAAISFNSVFLLNLFTMMEPRYWEHFRARPIFDILQSTGIIIYYLFICIAFIIFYYRSRQKAARPNSY